MEGDFNWNVLMITIACSISFLTLFSTFLKLKGRKEKGNWDALVKAQLLVAEAVSEEAEIIAKLQDELRDLLLKGELLDGEEEILEGLKLKMDDSLERMQHYIKFSEDISQKIKQDNGGSK